MDKEKKVLILEGKIEGPIPDYDHVFSFRSNPADSFPDDYLSEPEAGALYNRIYDALSHALESHPYQDRLTYRGVDSLWCFKKAFFEYTYLAAIRFEVFRRIRAKMPEAHFFISRRGMDLRPPFLADVIAASDLKNAQNISYLEGSWPRKDHPKANGQAGRLPLPSFTLLGNVGRCEVASCYDFKKAKRLLDRLRPFGCALFSTSQPRRMILRSLFYRFPLCQTNYQSKIAKPYEEKAESFLKTIAPAPCRLFMDPSPDGLNLDQLLDGKIRQIFRSELPKLLFEIDCAYRFFSKATNLKSVLLDEDISPARRAFCAIAQTHRVRTYVECHGLLGGKHGFVPPAADKIFVWGRAQKNKLIHWGCPEEKIIVSGYSRYERYLRLDSDKVKREVVAKLRLDHAKKIILVAFPPITHSWFLIFERAMRHCIEETLGTLTRLSGELREVQFVLKLHPADCDKKLYWEWARQHSDPATFKIVEAYDPLLLAKAADFLIVMRSTYAVDGFAMNKPVIYLTDESQILEEFRPYGIFTYVKDARELEDAVHLFARDPSFRPGKWQEARRDCLNEIGQSAEDFIVEHLTGVGVSTPEPIQESAPARAGAPSV